MSPATQTALPTRRLEARWRRLCKRCFVEDRALIDAIYQELVSLYTEPGRHYHNLAHVKRMLGELDGCAGHLYFHDAVEFAIWFHDAIYDTHASDNEARSADLAVASARRLNLPELMQEEIHHLIIATEHCIPPAEHDSRYIVDIDLVSLGLPYDGFKRFSKAIREEYSWVPEDVFRERRAELFEAFLARPSIYSTEHFRCRYEEQARENMERELAELRA